VVSAYCTGCGDCCASPHAPIPAVFAMRAAPWRAYPDPRANRSGFDAMFILQHGREPTDHERHVVWSLKHDARRVPEVWTPVEYDDTGTMARYECKVYDAEHYRCTEWEDRPPICRNYPVPDGQEDTLEPDAPLSPRCGYNRLIPHRALLPIARIREAGVDKSALR